MYQPHARRLRGSQRICAWRQRRQSARFPATGPRASAEPAAGLVLADLARGLPAAFEPLLPERDLVVAAADSEDIARERPREAPDDVRERLTAKLLDLPLGVLVGLAPDEDLLVLRARRDAVAREQTWRPRDVADPVRVPLERLLEYVLSRGVVEAPDLDEVIAATGNEAAHAGAVEGRPRARVSADLVDV